MKKKRIEKKYMTKFDYNVRRFAFISAILFIFTLAFMTPALDFVVSKTIELGKKITLLQVENNILKDQQDLVLK